MKHTTEDEEKSQFSPNSSWSSSSLFPSECTLERNIPSNGVRSPSLQRRTSAPACLPLHRRFTVCKKVSAPLTRMSGNSTDQWKWEINLQALYPWCSSLVKRALGTVTKLRSLFNMLSPFLSFSFCLSFFLSPYTLSLSMSPSPLHTFSLSKWVNDFQTTSPHQCYCKSLPESSHSLMTHRIWLRIIERPVSSSSSSPPPPPPPSSSPHWLNE